MSTRHQTDVLERPKSAQSDKKSEASLDDRLGGIFPIVAVIDSFSDEIIKNPVAGAESDDIVRHP